MTTSQPRQPKGQPVGGQFAGKHQTVDEIGPLGGGQIQTYTDLPDGTPPEWFGASITAANGTPYNIRYLPAGTKHRNAITGEYTRPVERDTIAFYDARYPFTPHGQFVSDYYAEDLLARNHDNPLHLDTSQTAWHIDGHTMQQILGWAAGAQVVSEPVTPTDVENAAVAIAELRNEYKRSEDIARKRLETYRAEPTLANRKNAEQALREQADIEQGLDRAVAAGQKIIDQYETKHDN